MSYIPSKFNKLVLNKSKIETYTLYLVQKSAGVRYIYCKAKNILYIIQTYMNFPNTISRPLYVQLDDNYNELYREESNDYNYTPMPTDGYICLSAISNNLYVKSTCQGIGIAYQKTSYINEQKTKFNFQYIFLSDQLVYINEVGN